MTAGLYSKTKSAGNQQVHSPAFNCKGGFNFKASYLIKCIPENIRDKRSKQLGVFMKTGTWKVLVAAAALGMVIALSGCGKGQSQEAATPMTPDTPPAPSASTETNPPEESTPATNAPDTPSAPAATADEAAFTINGLTFGFDTEKTFNGLSYTTSEQFAESEPGGPIPFVQYQFRQEDDVNLLYFRIFYYKDKDDAYALKDLGLEEEATFTEFKTDALDFRYYARPRDDGGTMHFYFLGNDNGNDTYVLSFISRYNLEEFEAKTIESVHF